MSNWFIVHPKGKELSLVTITYLDFSVGYEPKIRKRMEEMWPVLESIIEDVDVVKG